MTDLADAVNNVAHAIEALATAQVGTTHAETVLLVRGLKDAMWPDARGIIDRVCASIVSSGPPAGSRAK